MRDRLSFFLEAAIQRPFLWGQTDCFILATDWVNENAGKDVFAKYNFRKHYKTPLGAVRCYRKFNFKTIQDVWENFLNPVPVTLAKRGDICLSKIEGFTMPATGIVVDKFLSAFQSEKGLSFQPTENATNFYQVLSCRQ